MNQLSDNTLGNAIASMSKAPIYLGSPVFRKPAYGRQHPLSIPRVEIVHDICQALGWISDDNFQTCPTATFDELTQFHDADYVRALEKCDRDGLVDAASRKRFAIGTMENPLFAGVYERAATAVGGSIRAAELAIAGRTVFHPAGGTHHGRPDRASGFCYFNDPVFAILTLLRSGLERVLYIDLDAHHGDGVEDAFAADERVWTVSVHEADRWPHSGRLEDRGKGRAVNLPVPSGFHDAELQLITDVVLLPLIGALQPQAVVITCGADGLDGDPLSRMALTNSSLWATVGQLTAQISAAVVVGGGGYNPWTVARCWAGLWGSINQFEMPERLPLSNSDMLGRLECDLIDDEDIKPEWTTTLADPITVFAIREPVRALVDEVARRRIDLVPAT